MILSYLREKSRNIIFWTSLHLLLNCNNYEILHIYAVYGQETNISNHY